MSTGEFVGTIRIIDEATEPVKRIHEGTERATSGFRTATSVLANLGSVITQVSIMSYVYNLIQRQVEHSTVAAEAAAQRYQEALEKYGPASEKTLLALQKLTVAQDDLSRAQGESRLNTTLLMIQSGLLAVRFVEMAEKVNRYMKSVQIATIVDLIHTKVLAAKVAMIAAATFGLGLLIAAVAMAAAQAKTEEILGAAPTTAERLGKAPEPRGGGEYIPAALGMEREGITIHHEPHITLASEEEIDEAYRKMSEETKREIARQRT